MSRNFRSMLLLCLMSFTSVCLVFAQGGATGSITGTVSDNTGAVVSNAKVEVTNIATGVSHESETGSAGDYTVPSLNPGIYRVTVQVTGFGKEVVDNITLVVAQQSRVNISLKPGTVSETVEVNSGAVALDTDTSAISQLVSQRQVDQLPLNGRNFLNLLFIGAGAVQTVGEQGQMRQGEGNAISINGGRPESNNYTLDGMSNTDTALNTPAVILSQDAIQEFKVQSETYTAEYGFSANQVNIVSKSGTNALHGSVFEFNRNDAFDANTHFQPTKATLRQNQYGFVAGGPIWIPKLYDGRNKTFWLANYEGWRIKLGTDGFYDVPTAAELNGDFSATPFPAFGSKACIDALASNNPCQPIDPDTGAPFLGNVVPASRFSRVAKVTLGAKLYPAPNCLGGRAAGCPGNYHLATALPTTTDQQTYRGDQALGRLGGIFFRYTKAKYTLSNVGTVSLPAGLNIFTEDSTSWEVAHTITLGQRNVNSFRLGSLTAKEIQGSTAASAADVAALGVTGIFTNLPAYARGYPTIGFQNLATGGSPGNNPSTSNIPMWEYADSLSMSRGKHTIGVGFDFRIWVQKRNLSGNFLGGYNYNNNTILQNSAGCTTATGKCGTGNAVADFLLGYYNSANTFQPEPFSTPGIPGNENDFHFKYIAPYIQDDWKATEKLTINIGIRWDYRSVPFETRDKMFWIDSANTAGGLCFARKALLTDGVAPAGNGFYRYCGRRNPADGSKTPFAPRVGFAYRPFGGEKTVVRGGYGMYFDSSETREIDDSGDLYPFVSRTQESPTINATAPKSTDNLFPATSALHPVSVATDGGQFIAVIISEHPVNPYVQQWSLSMQRELARNTTLEVNYVGNKATHLLDRVNINQPNPVANPAVCQAAPSTADCPVAKRRPYQNFTAFATLDSRWDGYSNYNAANVKLERRTSDMAFVGVYTWSKSMDDKSAAAGIGASGGGFSGHLDDHNPQLDYARSDFDVDQRFVASYVYNLPVGRGKKYLGSINRLEDAAVGGWEITGIGTFQKGFPYSVSANDTFGLLTAFSQRANLVGDPNKGFHKDVNHWFNTAAFAQPIAGTYGNSGRNILRGPGISNWDMGVAKEFSFAERAHFQFRVESFNTFNHTQWGVDPGAPGVGPGSNAVDNNINDQAPSANVNFGTIRSARPGRILQLGGKITF